MPRSKWKVRLEVKDGEQRYANINNVGDRTEVSLSHPVVSLTADQLESLVQRLQEALRERGNKS